MSYLEGCQVLWHGEMPQVFNVVGLTTRSMRLSQQETASQTLGLHLEHFACTWRLEALDTIAPFLTWRMQQLSARLGVRFSRHLPPPPAAIARKLHALGSALMWQPRTLSEACSTQLSMQTTALTSLRSFRALPPAWALCSHMRHSHAAANHTCQGFSTAAIETHAHAQQLSRRGISCSAAAPLDVTAARQSGYDASQIQVTHCHHALRIPLLAAYVRYAV